MSMYEGEFCALQNNCGCFIEIFVCEWNFYERA